MVTKTAILLVAIFAVGSQAATVTEARHQLDVLLEKTNLAAKNAINQMENLEEVVRQMSNGVINVGTQQVHQESARLIKDLDDVVDAAKKEGFNIDSCMKNERRLLEEITDLSGLELAACANRFTSQAETGLERAMDHTRQIVDEVFDVSQKLENCKTTDVNCINTIVTEIEFMDIDIPRKIQEEWDQGQNRAEANRLYLAECGVRATQNLVTHGSALVTTVDQCVDKIIHPPKPVDIIAQMLAVHV